MWMILRQAPSRYPTPGVTVEDATGNILTNQDVNYTKVNGYADHFPVVVSFEYTYAK